MSFLHLYRHTESLTAQAAPDKCPVDVNGVRDWILDSGHATEIKVHAVSLNKDLSPGHVIIRDYREERWEAESDFRASIRVSDKLNRCGLRFVSCKEMMHIFDSADEESSNRQRFFRLMDEIETPPVPGTGSLMLGSEYRAEWMTLLLLCPKPLRHEYKAKLEANEITPYDVAWKFLIPQRYVGALTGERYDEAFQWLITDAAEPPQADPNDAPPAR